MRRILKQLRKGLRTACVTAALATCWNVGQPAQAAIVEHAVNFSGTVSPTVDDLSHLYLIYGTGYSTIEHPLGAISLGDFLAGQTETFSVFANLWGYETPVKDGLWLYTAGLYGDVSSGQYVEGVNGVVLGINASESDLWETYFPSLDEETAFSDLLNDNPSLLPSFGTSWNGWHSYYECDFEMADTNVLFDFSQASDNGLINIESEVVPEPITIFLFGSGGIFVLYSRRRKD